MKKGKPSYIKNTASVKSNIKNVININLAEKLAQQLKKKKTKKSIRRKSIKRQRGLEEQDTIELKPRSMMPQGNALTSGSALRISMPNQTFGVMSRYNQPSTYVIPNTSVLGTFQPSSFGVRDQQKTTQSIIEQAVAEAIKKNQPQPAGPNTRVVPSVNPYNPNDALVSDSNAITADDSDKKKAQDFVRELAQAKALSRQEEQIRKSSSSSSYEQDERSESLDESLEAGINFGKEAGERDILLQTQSTQIPIFTKAYYEYLYEKGIIPPNSSIKRKSDIRGSQTSDKDLRDWSYYIMQEDPNLWEFLSKFFEAGKSESKKFTDTIKQLLDNYFKASVASSSKFSEAPQAFIPPANQPVFGNELLLATARKEREKAKDVQKATEEAILISRRSRSKPRDLEPEQSGTLRKSSKSREPKELEPPSKPKRKIVTDEDE